MQGFKLTEEVVQEGFSGGSVMCSARGDMFDVGKALAEGDGVIYTNDDIFAQILVQYPALERIPQDQVPPDAVPVVVPGSDAIVAAGEVMAPWTPQGGEGLPQVRVEVTPGEGEVPAEHADEPSTEEQALAVGEAVAGTGESGADSQDNEPTTSRARGATGSSRNR